MFGGEVQFVLGFVQLRGELFQLLAQLAFELEHFANGFGIQFSAGGIEPVASAQHGFFNLKGDDGADLAEVFADGFNLEGRTHEEFQIAFQITDLAGDVGIAEAAANEVMDMHFVRLLAMGLQRSARIITAAALLLAVVFAAFMTSGVTSIKMLGFGVSLAVLLDATLIRALLVPALMRLFGETNWWAPKPLRRFTMTH